MSAEDHILFACARQELGAEHRERVAELCRQAERAGRLLLPVVAAGLVARTVVACLHRLAAGARGRHAVPIAGGRG